MQQHQIDEFRKTGFVFLPDILSDAECDAIVQSVKACEQRGMAIHVDRDNILRKQKFRTLTGPEIDANIPAVKDLYDRRCRQLAQDVSGEKCETLDNRFVGLSINTTPPGGTLSWHYDRNRTTVIAYLNDVDGGELEFYPRYRFRIRGNNTGIRKWLQRGFDVLLRPGFMRSIFGKLVKVKPKRGGIGILDSTCLHRVAPVEGQHERIAIVMSFDEQGKLFSVADTKDYYGNA